MGKAAIVGGGADGDYVVKLDYGAVQRDVWVKKIVARLIDLAPEIDKANNKLNVQKAKEAEKKAAAESAIDDYVGATKEVAQAFEALRRASEIVAQLASSATATSEERAAGQASLKDAESNYTAAQEAAKEKLDAQVKVATELVEEKRKTGPLQIALDLLKDERTQLRKDKLYWEGLALEETKQAWCADYTDDASGDVATIEIPGEAGHLILAPGAQQPKTSDGALVAREAQTGAQVFFNAAILPGWQKFKPTYRRGKITELDFDTDKAVVELYDAKSSAQNLDINQGKVLTDVPVKYMTCNANAFEVGDDCVVMFESQEWDSPVVIGFVSHPKSCRLSGIGVEVLDEDGALLGVVLIPQGEFGRSSGQWKERRVKELSGSNNFWQSSEKKEDYSVVSGTQISRGNTAVATLKVNSELVFSTKTNSAKQYIVSASSVVPYWAEIKFYKGTLADLNAGPAKTLENTAGARLDEWSVIDAHPNGKKFLAAHYAKHQSPNGAVTFATYIDKIAWFLVGDGNVQEAETIGGGVIVHYAIPALPYSDEAEGRVVPNRGSYRYEYVSGAHIGFDGKPIPHKVEVTAYATVNDPYGGISDAANSIRNNTTKYIRGPDEIIILDSRLHSSWHVDELPHGQGTAAAHEISRREFDITTKLVEIAYEDPRKRVAVLVEVEYQLTSSYFHEYDRNQDEFYEVHTKKWAASGGLKGTVKVMQDGITAREIEFGEIPRINYNNSVVYDLYQVPNPPNPDAFVNEHSAFFFTKEAAEKHLLLYFDRLRFSLVAAATDPFTGAVVMQLSLEDTLHWLVIDDTGVRDISAVSRLIPSSERARRIVSI